MPTADWPGKGDGEIVTEEGDEIWPRQKEPDVMISAAAKQIVEDTLRISDLLFDKTAALGYQGNVIQTSKWPK